MEVMTYVHLTAGLHCFAVNSDDNFRVTPATSAADPANATVLGEFNFVTGRGANDTVFRFYATNEGLYAMRLVMDQGTGGGNVEWWMADATSETITLINGSDAIKAFRPADQDPPVFTCPQQAVTAECGVPFDYPVTAIDAWEGAVAVICVPPDLSTFQVGTQTVHCTASDAFGNPANPACTFTVDVVDSLGPVITCPANITLSSCGDTQGIVVTYAATALDVCEGLVPVNCTPPSGEKFPVGTTTVTCTASDTASHNTNCTFDVTVELNDTTAPVVTCPADITKECVDGNGAPATWAEVTANDNCDGVIVATCVPGPGTFPIGDTTVTCTAIDRAQNSGSCTFHVIVRDTVPPVIVDCPGDQTLCGGADGAVATWTDPTGIDDCSEAVVTCNPPSGHTFPCGENTVICTARDAAGNPKECSFKITVNCPPRPTLVSSYDSVAMTVTLTWAKNDCYKLYVRDDIGVAAKATDLEWNAYTGTVTDDGTTATAVIQISTTGLGKFFLLQK
jgi:hypothetical protein